MMRYTYEKSGFTVTEAMLAVVILSIAASGVILPFSSGAALETEGSRLTLGASLASQMMETIAAKPLIDPNTNTSNDYDDIMDYNGYCESQGQLKDPAGTLLPGAEYACFARSVQCSYQGLPLTQQSDLFAPSCVIVTVSVSYRDRPIATLTRLISK